MDLGVKTRSKSKRQYDQVRPWLDGIVFQAIDNKQNDTNGAVQGR